MSGAIDNRLKTGVSRRVVLATMLAGVAAAGLPVIALAADGKVRVGFSHAHTGWAAAFDVAFATGYEWAVKQINAAGGAAGKYPIEIIKGSDSASSSVEAVKSADALLEQNLDILLLSCDASSAIAAGRAGQNKGVLMFPSTSTQPDVTTRVGDWMYLSNFSDNLTAGATALYVAKDLGLKSAYLLKSPDNPFTEFVPEYFGVTFEKHGGKVLGKGNYTFGQADFGGLIADIKGLPSEPDVIVTAAFEPELPAFLRQARAAGIKSKIVGADAIDTPSFFALGDLVEGVVVVSNRYPVAGSKYEELAARFGAEFPEHVNNSAWIVGYNAALFTAEAIRIADATDAASIRKALDTIKDFEAPTGAITFAGFERRPLMPVVFLEIEKGQGVFKKAIVIDPADIPAPM